MDIGERLALLKSALWEGLLEPYIDCDGTATLYQPGGIVKTGYRIHGSPEQKFQQMSNLLDGHPVIADRAHPTLPQLLIICADCISSEMRYNLRASVELCGDWTPDDEDFDNFYVIGPCLVVTFDVPAPE
jgi:hypothetical protein